MSSSHPAFPSHPRFCYPIRTAIPIRNENDVVVAVRPPEYFPRLPVAALLLITDVFVVADTLPLSRQSTHNRARIRVAQGDGRQWLTVPREHVGYAPHLCDTEIAGEAWRDQHLRALEVAYSMAPFWPHHRVDLRDLITTPYASLADLTTATMHWTSETLRSAARVIRASDMPGAPESVGEMIINRAGARILCTLPESAEADAQHASKGAAEVAVVEYHEAPRRQVFEGFVPGLSVLDLILNYGGEAAAERLRDESRVR